MSIIQYKPPPIIKAFIKHHEPSQLFYDWIVGPVGSGKTTGIFFKLIYMAKLQEASPDGIRRTRAVIVRNTMPQLKDTTLVSWGYWFKDGQAGHWNATDKIFTLRYDDVECQVLFRPLDTPDDVNRVLSLEINFAIIDEFVEVPKAIIDALSARLGRYRQPDGTPVTIWGMWGSSNPSTEDNWWYDHLYGTDVAWHGEDLITRRARLTLLDRMAPANSNTIYYHQPGGLTLEAENLDNLPGKRDYYVNLCKGRSKEWIKQFVDAEWGYSSAGQAVIPYLQTHHIAKTRLQFNPMLNLIIGFDPGITGSALILMQESYTGQIVVLRELVQRGYGVKRIVEQRLFPLLKNEFPDLDPARMIISLDPAGANRTQNDERTARDMLHKDYGFKVECETNNRFPLRLAAYEHYLNTWTEGVPAFLVDPVGCPSYVRALKGGWRYAADVKKEILKGVDPEKNEYSHTGDAGGYGLRYFHKGQLRFEKFGVRGRLVIPNPMSQRGLPNNAWGTAAPSAVPLTRSPKYHYT